MMQSADLLSGDDFALRRQFHLAWRGRVAIQRQMRPAIVIVVKVLAQDAAQMPFV